VLKRNLSQQACRKKVRENPRGPATKRSVWVRLGVPKKEVFPAACAESGNILQAVSRRAWFPHVPARAPYQHMAFTSAP
jgi:hypothetical protein